MNAPEKVVIPMAGNSLQARLMLEYNNKGFGMDERNYLASIFPSASSGPQIPLAIVIHDAHDVPPRLSHAGRVHALQFGRTFFYITPHDAPALKDWLEQCRDYERYLEGEHAT